MEETNEKPTYIVRAKKFYGECLRVLTITKKPSSVEYKTIVKVSGLGMAAIGIIGFIITLVKQLVFG